MERFLSNDPARHSAKIQAFFPVPSHPIPDAFLDQAKPGFYKPKMTSTNAPRFRWILTTALVVGGLFALYLDAQKSVSLSKLPFSPSRSAGDLIYVSGQIARTPDGKDVKDSVASETRQVMENIGQILEKNGCTFDDVVNATVYLNDINDYHAMNAVYASFFKDEFPARACVGGVDLVFDFKVEISCVAQPSR